MFVSLEEIYDKYGYNIKSIKKYDYITQYIIKLFNGENLENLNKNYKDIILNNNSDIFLWNGYYYKDIEEDYTQMKKYLLMAIELGNTISMNNLAIYYKNIEKDYTKMKEYLLMAIELGNSESMNILGYYYYNIEKDYDKMKEYYGMAIELGHVNCMNNLGNYYFIIEKDFSKMIEYFLMAVNLGHVDSMFNLGYYYENIEEDYQLMKEYYEMAVELDYTRAMRNLELYYANIEKDYTQMEKYYFMREKNNPVSIFKLARLYHKKYLNEEKAIEYYLIFFETCHYDCMNLLTKCFDDIKNKLYIYKIVLDKLNNPDITVDNKEKYRIIESVLLSNDRVLLWYNKITFSKKYNIIDKCALCLEEKLSIPLYCAHTVCVDCYVTNNKCYYAYCNNIIKNNSIFDNKFNICCEKKIELNEVVIDELEVLNKIYNNWNH